MTTLAMIFGMLPLAAALGEGGEQRGPLGQTVIGGVITSSILTLVVVPVVYTMLEDWADLLRRKFGRKVDPVKDHAITDKTARSCYSRSLSPTSRPTSCAPPEPSTPSSG
jgi:hypothetical protein